MIRPAELTAIKAGEIDLAFRRWDRPRVVVGTKMRTGVGLLEVTSVEEVDIADLSEEDARRGGPPPGVAGDRARPRRARGHRRSPRPARQGVTDRPVDARHPRPGRPQ